MNQRLYFVFVFIYNTIILSGKSRKRGRISERTEIHINEYYKLFTFRSIGMAIVTP